MKRFFATMMIALSLVACKKEEFGLEPEIEQMGKLSFASLDIQVSKDTEVVTRAEEGSKLDGYLIYLYNSKKELVNGTAYTFKDITKGAVDEQGVGNGSISLPADTYRMEIRSLGTIPVAEFDEPVYGATVEGIVVTAGETTTVDADPSTIGEIDPIVCTLLQCKVTVDYNDDFLKMVAGDCTVDVTVTTDSDGTLTYPMSYNGGSPTFKEEPGYFKVNSTGNTTMEVKFSGTMYTDDSKTNTATQRMTKTFDDIAAKQWRKIKFIKKVNEDGSATFDIVIDDLIEDTPLKGDEIGAEEILGEDPNAPKGDGGILLETVEGSDIVVANIVVVDENNEDTWETEVENNPIVIEPLNGSETPTMALKMKASVPNGVRKFSVTITSTSDTFNAALDVVGGNVIDLVNPSEKAKDIFEIVPFPNGEELVGMTDIDFDLSNAQQPILGFSGTHTFLLTVVDQQGCQKKYAIAMKINDPA